MKKTLIFPGALALAFAASAQSGTVVYNETMKLEIHIDGMDAGMAEMLPKERKSVKMLHFTPDASIYVNGKQNEDQEVAEEMAGGGTMVIRMDEADEQLYYDIKNQKITEQRDFMSRLFLIESAVDSLSWKLTGNRRDILGYPCIEATYQKDTVRTVAWFTPAIPVSTGPGKYHGLPGIILEVNVDDGKRIISAASVTDGDVAALLVRPKKGRKVSGEEFNKIVEEKTGEMEGEGGATIMIKISK
ncbi:MAG: GLPGLI family protein [Bacteroidales bacterium]|nr:GLPGLI family protein [Bacteroidales bacterium]